MKYIGILLFAFGLFCLQSCNSGMAENAEATASVEMSIEGMVCAMGCAKSIENEMSKLSGIVEVKVDFEHKNAVLKYDKSLVSSKVIESKIEGMNDGQYQVEILNQKDLKAEGLKSKLNSRAKDKVEAKQNQFSFPRLITYFMNNL